LIVCPAHREEPGRPFRAGWQSIERFVTSDDLGLNQVDGVAIDLELGGACGYDVANPVRS
jgi:hypothetical protein